MRKLVFIAASPPPRSTPDCRTIRFGLGVLLAIATVTLTGCAGDIASSAEPEVQDVSVDDVVGSPAEDDDDDLEVVATDPTTDGDDAVDESTGAADDLTTGTGPTAVTSSGAADPETNSTDAKSTTTTDSESGSAMHDLIVELQVEWQPEANLDADGVARQRERIAEAQAAVIDLLEGTDYEVKRLFDVTAQMAIIVDADGLEILQASDLVSDLSGNVPDPSG